MPLATLVGIGVLAMALGPWSTRPALAVPPAVVGTSPASQALGVPLDAVVEIELSGDVDPATIVPANVLVTSSLRGPNAIDVTWQAGAGLLRLHPQQEFLPGERVAVTLTRGIRSGTGEPLAGGHRFDFTTWSAPSPGGEFLTSPASWPIGSIAFNATPIDLDGDGLPEIVFSNAVPDSLTILTPDGAGSFSPYAQLPTAILPRHVATGDVDQDGLPDLVCCGSGPNVVQVFRNLGAGAFRPAEDWITGQTPYGAWVGDLDADGDLDIATANFNSHDISVLRNEGGAVFATAVSYPAGPGADSPRFVDGADLDGDGDIDLVCCNGYSYDVSVFLNVGDGTLVSPTALLPTGDSPQYLELRDFSGDGLVDILTVDSIGETISLLRGNGDGTFQAVQSFDVAGQLPYGLQVVDLDGDLDLDVVVPIRGLSGWRPMWNDGAGNFSLGSLYLGGNHCHTIAAADWDHDGDIDVAAGFAISRDMFLYTHARAPGVVATMPRSNATGVALDAPIELYFDTELTPDSIVAAGFRIRGTQSGPHVASIVWDGGSNRVVLTPQSPFLPGEVVHVTVTSAGAVTSMEGVPSHGWSLEFLTEGATAFAFDPEPEIALPGVDPVDLAVSELDGDGIADLVVANYLSNDVTVLLSNGGMPQVSASVPTGIGPIAIWPDDFDGDGINDVAVANTTSGSISILLNAGDGTLVPGVTVNAVGAPFALVGADFDQDGDQDLAVTEVDPNGARVHWNDGTGAFPTREWLPIGGFPLDLAVADFDNDGRPDLIVVDAVNDHIALFRRQGNAFVATSTENTGSVPVGVFPWDTNGDGWIDLVSANYGGGGISVIENAMDGTFLPAVTLASGALPHAVWGADLTGDGRLDLASANSGSSAVSVFRNVGSAGFAAPAQVAVGETPYSLVGADWNQDGRIDLATVNRTSGGLSFLLNSSPTDAPVLPSVPAGFELRIRPNPSVGDVSLAFDVPREAPARVRIFDVRGRQVADLFD
ncbi:MAG: VCBS repeat-containing protein, partial [Gemmatimonadetes bacterium]|nr:VCBS repeat-containing protein [Gemmatimonadota bacterium]